MLSVTSLNRQSKSYKKTSIPIKTRVNNSLALLKVVRIPLSNQIAHHLKQLIDVNGL